MMVDFYSLGVLLYEMMVGVPPFYDPVKTKMLDKIVYSEPKFPSAMDNDTKEFIQGLLCKDPSRRLGAKGIGEIKRHQFMKGVEWNDLQRLRVMQPSVNE